MLAYQYAKENHRKGFSDVTQRAGKRWLRAFEKRHTDITFRKARRLSKGRTLASVSRTLVDGFFGKLDAVQRKLDCYDPARLWNVDEKGLSDLQNPESVACKKGTDPKQTVHGEYGENSTVLAFFNAVGEVVPPMVIHASKAKKVNGAWRTGMPPGVVLEATESGYINKHKFTKYAAHFVQYLKNQGRLDKPHLLLVDGHKSHVYNLPMLEFLMRNNVYVLCFPPKCTHFLQPADKVPYKELEQYFNMELSDFNIVSCGAKPKKSEWFSIFWPAWTRAMTKRNIKAGWAKTGISPRDPSAVEYAKLDPLPSKLTY